MSVEPASLIFRPARREDAAQLRRWRNDPLTRAASIQTAAVSEAEHLQWLEALLTDGQRQLLVAWRREQPVGCVRFDIGERETEVSWTVAPEARGHGIGSRMVQRAVAERSEALMARVRLDNPASARIAESAGLNLDETRDQVRFYRRPKLGTSKL